MLVLVRDAELTAAVAGSRGELAEIKLMVFVAAGT